jgi:heat shock protein HslJ
MRDARTILVVGGVVALVALGALAATLAGGDDTANGYVPVEGLDQLTGSWLAVNDASAPAIVIGTVRLEFSEDGRVTAQTGCNGVRGQVSVQDSTLVAGPLTSTRMACEPALMEQERWVTEMLSSHPRLELSGPYLALHWGEGEQWWLGLEREPEGTSGTFPAS